MALVLPQISATQFLPQSITFRRSFPCSFSPFEVTRWVQSSLSSPSSGGAIVRLVRASDRIRPCAHQVQLPAVDNIYGLRLYCSISSRLRAFFGHQTISTIKYERGGKIWSGDMFMSGRLQTYDFELCISIIHGSNMSPRMT